MSRNRAPVLSGAVNKQAQRFGLLHPWRPTGGFAPGFDITGRSDDQSAPDSRGSAGRRPESTPCSRWRLPAERQLCSGSGHSRPQRELTVSATFRSSRRQRDRDADDRSQGSADVARRMCVARWFPERQLNRCRGHWASKTNRMSAAHGAGLTHPTPSCRSCSGEAAVREFSKRP